MKLVLEPIWSWPVIAFAIGALLALVLLTYPPRIQHLPPLYRRLLLGLRLTAAVLLVLAMLRPAIQHRETDRKKAVLLVVGDRSGSMGTKDAPGGISRRDQMLRTLSEIDTQIEALAGEIEIRYYDFAESLMPVEQFSNATPGQQTAIGTMLDELLREAQGDHIIGVVLLSDGAQRALPGNDADPREKARLLRQGRVPVYTVGFGGSGLADTAVDLAVEDLLVAPVVFEKKLVHIDAKIRAYGARGRELTIQLILEDRFGKRPGQAGTMITPDAESRTKPFDVKTPKTDDELIPVQLSFVPNAAGEYKIGIRVVEIDGELKTANNQQVTIINVRAGGIRVMYFDRAVRAEHKFIRDVNTSENIQLDFLPVFTGKLESLNRIEPELFLPGRYDAYIIGDVPARLFTVGGKNLLDELTARVREGAGLLMTGGQNSFAAGGYHLHPEFADLLPVIINKNDFRREDEVDASLHYLQQLKMVPTEKGLKHFIMLLDSPEAKNRQRWQSLPPLTGANRLTKKEGLIDVLAEAETGEPLLFARFEGDRVMAFAADTTYLWYLGGHQEAHQRFWRQIILWLTGNEQGNRDVWIQVEPRNLSPKQTVGFTFGAKDKENRPIPGAEFTVTVDDPQGKRHSVSPRHSGEENSAEFRNTDEAGDYWVKVVAEFENEVDGNMEKVAVEGWSRFIVEDRDLEMDNPAVDFDLLKDISETTGGKFLQPEELGSFLQHKAEEDLTIEFSKLRRTSLWDNWTFLLCFVGVMSVEWFIRKRRGLV